MRFGARTELELLCAMFALVLAWAAAAFAQSSPASAPTGNADQELQQAFSAMSAANVTAMMNASDAMKAQQAFQQAFQAWRTAQQGREASMQRQLASVNRALQSEQKTELAMRGRLQAAEAQADQNGRRPPMPIRPTLPPQSQVAPRTGAASHSLAQREPNYSNTGPNLPRLQNVSPQGTVLSPRSASTWSGPHPVGPQSHPGGAPQR